MPPTLELALLPLITGTVGYLTNKLAIKMLFRPYEPKWYTFGWQGIVPRTRATLAKKVGMMVSSQLISEADIEKALSSESFQTFAQETVSKKLKEITSEDIKNVINCFDIGGLAANLLQNDDIKKFIAEKAGNAVTSEKSLDTLASEIVTRINNFIYSGKTPESVLPETVTAKKEIVANHIADAIENAIKQTARSTDVKEAAAEKIIAFKNSFFDNSGADQFKMGLMAMFLDDEAIANAVKREMPAIADSLAQNPAVRGKILAAVNLEIDKLLKIKLSELTDKAGHDTLPAIYSALKMNIKSEKFVSETKRLTNSLLEKSTLNIYISGIMDVNSYKKPIDILAAFAAKYISERADDAAELFVSKGTVAVKSGIRPALEKMDISGMVERKINSLELPEVEEVLFSFMRSHFKWINILGFVIGFIIGGIQAAAVLLTK